MEKMSRISHKVVIWFILLGTLLCLLISVAGLFQYNKSIQRIYNATAYDTAEIALSFTSPDELSRLASLARGYNEGSIDESIIKEEIASPRYQELYSRIRSLREAIDANDVFIFIIDMEELESYSGTKEGWLPLLYLVDCYVEEESLFELGDAGAFNPKYIDALSRIARTGERVKGYFISDGDYGYNTSALLPVPAGDDLAIIAVEIPMRTLNSELRTYIIGSVAITIVVVAAIIVLFYLSFEKMFVSPIKRMADAASNFISGDANAAMTSSIASLEVNSDDELAVLCDSLKQMERNIITYMENLQSMTAERERISTELGVARHIQTSMLPCIFPKFPNSADFDIYATMMPGKEVGGDFYDFFMVDETHIAIVIADVSGKGVPSALFMLIGKMLIKERTLPGADLGEVFSKVNDLLCDANSDNLFITAFEGVLDLETGRLYYVNAGHEMPFLCMGGKFEAQEIKPGLVLAGFKGIKYTMSEFILKPGDKIFLYTNGIPEAESISMEPFGMARLGNSLNRNAKLSPYAIISAVNQNVRAFLIDAPQLDDIAMLCLEYKKGL